MASDGAQTSKWEQYYAADPRAAPWDTHAVSSQLRTYLCGCPICDASESSTPTPASAERHVVSAPSTAPRASWVGPGPARPNPVSTGNPIHSSASPRYLCPYPSSGDAGSGKNGGSCGGGGSVGNWPGLHACALCAAQKPAAAPSSAGAVRALELCCGTGASLAFLRGLGFSVVGMELVAAACHLAAHRLTAVAGAPVAVQSVDTVAETLRLWADADAGRNVPLPELARQPVPAAAAVAAAAAASEAAAAAAMAAPAASPMLPEAAALRAGVISHPSAVLEPRAVVACGDLFAAHLPRGFFDLAYDCQGLHAMPPALRPAYVLVLRDALRSGGLALLLMGRAEADEDGDEGGDPTTTMSVGIPSGQAAHGEPVVHAASPSLSSMPAAVDGVGAGRCGEGGGGNARTGAGTVDSGAAADPRVDGGGGGGGQPASSRGPSLMSLPELRALFGAPSEWEWCWCRPTRFDATPTYARLPRPPPAWCLLLRRI